MRDFELTVLDHAEIKLLDLTRTQADLAELAHTRDKAARLRTLNEQITHAIDVLEQAAS
ncbi:MAG: hypothetical protein AAF495_25365 [Pseudomonadota bacterium]